METSYIIICIIVMTVVTYVVRLLPFVLFKKQIKSRFFKSFLYYVPYAVLSAMAFPAIFTATGNTVTSLAAALVALVLAFFKKSLVVVSGCAAITALILSFII